MYWIKKLEEQKKQIKRYDNIINKIEAYKMDIQTFYFLIIISLSIFTFFVFIFSKEHFFFFISLAFWVFLIPVSAFKIKKINQYKLKKLNTIKEKKQKLVKHGLLKNEKHINLLFKELQEVGLDSVNKKTSEEIIVAKRKLISEKSKIKGLDFLIQETIFLETINNEKKNLELIND